MQAERGLSARHLSTSEVESMLSSLWGYPEKARAVVRCLRGKYDTVDEVHIMCLLQAVRELAEKAGHYVKFMYEGGAQVRFLAPPCTSYCLVHPIPPSS
jgi:hypothetical protein